MRTRFRRTLLVTLVTALALMLVLPAGALGLAKPVKTGARPQLLVPADKYESDNGTATAKVLPEVSSHTFSSSETTPDEDWSIITAEATGTPFVLETQSSAGWFDSDLDIFTVGASGALVPAPTAEGYSSVHNDDSDTWAYTYGSTLYWSAPAPGTYYVRARPHYGNANDPAFYTLYESKGIARRIGGSNRFETAAAVSRTLWPETNNPWYGTDEGPHGIIIANAWDFPDALAASAWSAMGDSDADNLPILLVNKDSVPAATAAEFQRLIPTNNWDYTQMKIYVLGSTNAVSDGVVKQLMSLSDMPFRDSDVVRLAGTTRYGTAAAIADRVVHDYGNPSTVFITTGSNFPDGLAVAPLAGVEQGPVLYSKLATVGPETSAWLLAHPSVTDAVIVGGTGVISDAVASALATEPYNLNVVRKAGNNRYETARVVAQYGVDEYGLDAWAFLVNGQSFPDALGAGTLSGQTRSVILLTPGSSLSSEVTTFFANNSDEMLPDPADATGHSPNYVIGGPMAITPTAFNAFRNLYKMF